jgi:hypothetical protein
LSVSLKTEAFQGIHTGGIVHSLRHYYDEMSEYRVEENDRGLKLKAEHIVKLGSRLR